jgi:hypothetical protein
LYCTRAEVSCPVEELAENTYSTHKILRNFVQAVQIAEVRPLGHNLIGIMNGVDAVVLLQVTISCGRSRNTRLCSKIRSNTLVYPHAKLKTAYYSG